MWDWLELRERIVLWEDGSTLVVNKPPGVSVMGERHDTDLVTLAEEAGEPLRWVNRIDKVTSGAVVLAKTKKAHAALTRQFALRTVDKAYLAVVRPGGVPSPSTIDLPLLTASSGRIRVAAERQHLAFDGRTWSVAQEHLLPKKNYPSLSEVRSLWDDGSLAVLLVHPVTGRRHQIRVHLAWTGHAIVGDPLFTRKTDAPEARTHLHSLRVAFDTATVHPRAVEVEAPPGDDFWAPVPAASPEALLAATRVPT